MANKFATLIIAAVLCLAGFAYYRLVQNQVAAQVYRHRLTQLNSDYRQLQTRYNQVVARTAATLLLVHDGKLTVVIRDADGEIKKIPTPYNPSHEIYVDYIVKDGRLWIRRVFDDQTPAKQATLIDPKLGHIDWSDATTHGKAVYRALSPGVWEINVTGDGSLGLRKCKSCDPQKLIAAPSVKDFKPLKEKKPQPALRIGPAEVLRHMLAGD